MDALFSDFVEAQHNQIGYLLATTISPEPPEKDPARLYSFQRSSSEITISTDLRYKLQYNPGLQLSKDESKTWQDIYTLYYKFVTRLLTAQEVQNSGKNSTIWTDVYNAWKAVVNSLLKAYSESILEAWTLPCLYIAGKYLRVFAIKADDAAAALRDSGIIMDTLQEEESENKHENLEDAARQINRIFSICNGDRNPIEISRKWALYYIASLLFKTYFRLSSLNLCKNILKTLAASAELPPLTSFPKSHQVTFNYYAGVIHFLNDDYAQAEQFFELAYALCSSKSTRNVELILMYLIPTKMITKHQLPRPALLSPYPRLKALFSPIIDAVRQGNLTQLDDALVDGEAVFVMRRIYLTLERSKDVAIRNLFRKLYIAGGFEPTKEGETAPVRRTRIPLAEFSAALLLAGAEVQDGEGGVDTDEVECIIANMIYKNMMKGYIARDRGIVVLSKAEAFPGTGL